jgi:predicted dehydrogenase
MSGRLTASVVGAGAGGTLSMVALRDSDRYELVAVADISPKARQIAEERFSGIRTFDSHEAMFAACPTDVVCVSTWPPTHESVTMDALELSLKGILVEKPLGHTADSGRRILMSIKQKQLPMAVPHGLLVNAAPMEIISRVWKGEIGELKLVEIQNTGWDIINAGIHWLDFFVTLTGNEEMDYVMAICESSSLTYRDGMQVETTAVTYAQTRSGIRVVMNTGDEVQVNRTGKSTLFRLIGTAGQIEFWGWENAYHILSAEFPTGQMISPQELPGTRHQRHMDHMADMIASGNTDYTIAEGSLLALEICEGAYISSRHRCKVSFPVDEFSPPIESDWDPGMPYGGSGGGRNGRRL